jgi:hypothetical protein
MLSAITAPPSLPEQVHSALLLQPAVSHLCFAADANGKGGPGGYRPAIKRVTQPIVATYSRHDFALTRLYHLALRRGRDLGEVDFAAEEPPSRYAALGGYGPRPVGDGVKLVDVRDPGRRYDLGEDGLQVLGVDCTNTIGGHGKISNESTWWMLYDLVTR